MSTIYPFVPTQLPASVTLPQDLVDQRTAASVNVPMTAIGNGVAYIDELITRTVVAGVMDMNPRGSDVIAPTWNPTSAPTQFAPVQDNSANGVLAARCVYYTDYSGLRFYDANAGSASARHVMLALNPYLLQDADLTRLTLTLDGQAGHVGLPASMPAMGIARWSPETNVWDSLVGAGLTYDSSASTADYEVAHPLRVTPDTNITIDLSTYVYYAVVKNESSTNALSQLRLRSLHIRQYARRYQHK